MKRRVAAGLLLATAVLMAGCVQKPEEGGTLPPLASPSVTPSAAPSPRATGTDLDQIIALTKDYYAEITKAANTGDTKRLRSLATPQCDCQKIALNLEKVWSTGSIKAPNYFMLREVSLPRTTSATTAITNAVFTVNESRYFDKSGRVTKTFPADPKVQVHKLDLVKVDGSWKVAGVSLNN